MTAEIWNARASQNLFLSPRHSQELRVESAIGEREILARGYETVEHPTHLLQLGFAGYQARTPGLLVPGWTVTGEPGTPQYKPDSPRIDARGRAIKYETPTGVGPRIDVPPAVFARLGDPDSPLDITEGSKKADSAVSHGLDCVSLAGVYGWRGRNANSGLTRPGGLGIHRLEGEGDLSRL
jgi:hypothetical protein